MSYNLRPNISIGARFSRNKAETFKKFCASRGENVSSVLRRLILTELAVHSLLPDYQKKSLGQNCYLWLLL